MIKSIEDRIEDYLKNLSVKNANLSNFLRISKDWQSIVGVTISKICAPSFLNKDLLTITVIDSSWAYEINMQRLNIVKKIKEETGVDIKSIRTVIGEIEYEIVERKKIDDDIYLNDNDIDFVNDVSKKIEDDVLRNDFKRLISKHIKHIKREKKEIL